MATFRLLINPISGTKSKLKAGLESRLVEALSQKGHVLETRRTYYQAHATELAQEAVDDGVDVLIIAGGDGTINEVLAPLHHSKTALSIIPLGSGNGIARSLGIPLQVEKAIQVCAQNHSVAIDLGKFGDRLFLGVAGIGFDAHIAKCFREESKRGLWKYAWLIIRECMKYSSPQMKLRSGDILIEEKVFISTAANANQYGNNAYIDKSASMRDGLLNMVYLKSFPSLLFPFILFKGMTGRIVESRFADRILADNFEIETESKIGHVDGEPIEISSPIKISLNPEAIKILLP